MVKRKYIFKYAGSAMGLGTSGGSYENWGKVQNKDSVDIFYHGSINQRKVLNGQDYFRSSSPIYIYNSSACLQVPSGINH